MLCIILIILLFGVIPKFPLLSNGIPILQLLYTIPKTGAFPEWYNASRQYDCMALWVLAICHKVLLFAKVKFLSLSMSVYIFMLASRESFTYFFAKLIHSQAALKFEVVHMEGTNNSKCHFLKNVLIWTWFLLEIATHEVWQHIRVVVSVPYGRFLSLESLFLVSKISTPRWKCLLFQIFLMFLNIWATGSLLGSESCFYQ